MTVVATVVAVREKFIELTYRAFKTGELLTVEIEVNDKTKNWKVDDLIVVKMQLMDY